MTFDRSFFRRAFWNPAIALSLTVWCLNAHAYEVNKTSRGKAIKWSTSSVTYFINTSGGPSGNLSAIQQSLQTWTNVGTSSFTFLDGGSTSSTAWGENDGKNIACFGSMEQNGTLAVNYTWYYSSTGEIVDSDLKFNTDYPYNTDGSPNAFDVQNIATHELGHSLSLDDLYSASDSDKTMYGYAAKGETYKRTLTQDDKDGITYLYPSSFTTTSTTTSTTTTTSATSTRPTTTTTSSPTTRPSTTTVTSTTGPTTTTGSTFSTTSTPSSSTTSTTTTTIPWSTTVYVQPSGTCGGNSPCYSTIQEAIDATESENIVRILQGAFDEDLIVDQGGFLTLSGGWDMTFTIQLSNTVIKSLTITSNGGTVEIDSVVLK